jgi:hypothetical protein
MIHHRTHGQDSFIANQPRKVDSALRSCVDGNQKLFYLLATLYEGSGRRARKRTANFGTTKFGCSQFGCELLLGAAAPNV